MTKNSLRGLTVLAIILAVFSIVAFVVPFVQTPVFWIAYACGVFAVLFQLYIFRAAHTADGSAKSRFYGFPIVRVGLYYLVAQLIVSILEMALANLIPVWAAVIFNALLAAAVIIGCITVETMRDEIEQQDGQLKQKVSAMRELQSMAAAMVGQCSDEDLKKTLQKIADELRFSDPVTSDATASIEAEMRSQLADIQQAVIEGDTEGAKTLCRKMMGNLAERNRVCSVNK